MNTRAAGSYYRNDFQRAASGLGDDQALSFADQTLIGIVQDQPSITYTEWASLSGDVTWTEVVPTKNYQAFALLDQQLVAAQSLATSAPSALAVVSPRLTFGTQVSRAFEKTPYAYQKTEAVYAQLDPASPPQIYFLYWLLLRPQTDPLAGNASMNFAAAQVAGVLAYILEVPSTGSDRARPGMAFTQAFQLQAAKSPLSIPQTPAQQQTVLIPAAATAAPATSQTSGNATALLIVGLGAAAAIGGFHLATRKR